MSVAKHIEITASSNEGFDDAVRNGIALAGKTVKGITGAWVQDQKVVVNNNAVTEYRVAMKVTFLFNE